MSRQGVTLDTGALIALERKTKRMRDLIASALAVGETVTVPSVVVLEWWRAGNGQAAILERLSVEATTERIAKVAGEAIAKVGASAIDAAVMASAALRGDVVYTSDVDDFDRLSEHFRSVRVLSVSGRGA